MNATRRFRSLTPTTAQTQTVRDVKSDVLKWLAAPDVMKKQSSVAAERFPGTCGWVFDHETFTNWSAHGRALWINGIGECIPVEQKSIAGGKQAWQTADSHLVCFCLP